ncbi:MAG: polysaccharide deacetylase family protein [Promethearchaeota archaeon]
MNHLVYLTIDDGPSLDTKNKINFLKKRGIKALWFCRGVFIEKHFEQALDILSSGHLIGNHSFSHPHFSRLSFNECKKEIERTDNLISKLYKRVGIERKWKFFRFPYGDKGAGTKLQAPLSPEKQEKVNRIQEYLKETGHVKPIFKNITYSWYKELGLDKDIDVYWTFDTLDWCLLSKKPKHGIHSIDDVLKRLDFNEPGNKMGLNDSKSNDIIVLHDFEQLKDVFVHVIEKILNKSSSFSFPKFKK